MKKIEEINLNKLEGLNEYIEAKQAAIDEWAKENNVE